MDIDRELVGEPVVPMDYVALEGYMAEHAELRCTPPYVILRIVADSAGFDFSIKRLEEPGVVIGVMISREAYLVKELDKGTRVFVGGKAYPQMRSLGLWSEDDDHFPGDIDIREVEMSACRDAAKESDSPSQ